MKVNGQECPLAQEGMSLSAYLLKKGLNPEAVVVEKNGEVVKRTDFESARLFKNDILEILKFVGGGA